MSCLTRSFSVLKLKSEHDSLHEPLLRLLKAHPNLKYLNNDGLVFGQRDLSQLLVLPAKHFHRRVAGFLDSTVTNTASDTQRTVLISVFELDYTSRGFSW